MIVATVKIQLVRLSADLTFFDFVEPAYFAASPIRLEIFFAESFPGGWFSSGLWKG
jgi:hypothetical protein